MDAEGRRGNTVRTIFVIIIASLAALPIAGCGDPLFFAEVEEERVCLTIHGQEVPASEAGGQSVKLEDDVDLGSKIPGLDNGATGSLHLLSLEVTASTDLSGVHSAAVSMSPVGSAPTNVASYTQPATMPDPKKVSFTVDGNQDLFQSIQSGKLHLAIEFAGAPPSTPWSADVDVCLSARIMIDALKAIQK